MNLNKAKFLKQKANQIRDKVIQIAVRNKAGHIAPSLSSVDILVALYYEAMSFRPSEPLWQDRDRLIFSKAHGCYALYAILADLGIIPDREWSEFYSKESNLHGCIERRPEFGLEASCGSLGHGLPMAVGIAFGAKIQKKAYRNFCVLGDGELQEGSNWEALQFAVKHELSNLTIIIDCNRLQAMDFIVNILDKEVNDKIKRLRGFGLFPLVCPGHDAAKLSTVISKTHCLGGRNPIVIMAKTIKGYGLKCMENIPKFHFRIPTDDELALGKTYE